MTAREIVIYHSPDADDAFMFYGLTSGAVQQKDYVFTHELCDIETLNQRTLRGELDVTAISVHAYPYLKDQYAILTCGASMGGKDYGPRLIATSEFALNDGKMRKIAIPGQYTSATLALRIYLREKNIDAELINLNFDQVQEAVKAGSADAGVIIHEGQITHQREGLVTLLDLGKWWWEETQLPLPLGVNVARRSLGEEASKASKQALFSSISYSLENRKQALEYALSYGRGITEAEADEFVSMYVNEKTLDLGKDGKESIELFLARAQEYGFVPAVREVVFI